MTAERTLKRIKFDYRARQMVADRRRKEIQRIIVEALKVARDTISQQDLEGIVYGRPDALREAIKWDRVAEFLGATRDTYYLRKAASGADIFGQIFIQGGGTVASQISGSLNLTNDLAVSYGEQRAGSLIVGLQAEQLNNVRTALGAGLSGELPVSRVEGAIRNTVGLSARQAQALVNYESGLVRYQMNGGAKSLISGARSPLMPRVALDQLTEGKIDSAVAAYRDRLIENRAQTIARTETMRAANAGAYEEMIAAGQNGWFDPTTARRVWSLTPDDRLCEFCASMEGQSVEFTANFVASQVSASGEESVSEVEYPPLHPNCRCSFDLEIVEATAPPIDEPDVGSDPEQNSVEVPELEQPYVYAGSPEEAIDRAAHFEENRLKLSEADIARSEETISQLRDQIDRAVDDFANSPLSRQLSSAQNEVAAIGKEIDAIASAGEKALARYVEGSNEYRAAKAEIDVQLAMARETLKQAEKSVIESLQAEAVHRTETALLDAQINLHEMQIARQELLIDENLSFRDLMAVDDKGVVLTRPNTPGYDSGYFRQMDAFAKADLEEAKAALEAARVKHETALGIQRDGTGFIYRGSAPTSSQFTGRSGVRAILDTPEFRAIIEGDTSLNSPMTFRWGREDPVARLIAEKQGFTGLPQAQSWSELEVIMDNPRTHVLYRGLEGDDVPLHINQFRNGEFRAGTGIHGTGTYTSSSFVEAIDYGEQVVSNVMMMVLDPRASIIDSAAVREVSDSLVEALRLQMKEKTAQALALGEEWAAKGPTFFREGNSVLSREMRNLNREIIIVSDLGNVGSMMGYDAMYLARTEALLEDERIVVLFNRTSVIMPEHNPAITQASSKIRDVRKAPKGWWRLNGRR